MSARTRPAAAEAAQLRDVLDRLPDALIGVDAELTVRVANETAIRLFRPEVLAEGTLLPKRWKGFDVRRFARDLFEQDHTGREIRIETRTATYSVVGIPADEGGSALLLIEDASTREQKSRAEREFVVNAAHELRNPLAAISTSIEVLQAGAKDTPEARDRFLAHIERECGRLKRLAGALLVLARAQVGERARSELVEVRPLLERVARSLDPSRGVEVRVDCAPSAAVFAPSDLLEQALQNLAVNAIAHTSQGEIVLCGRVIEGQFLVLEVLDTGVGIPEDAGARVFERFYRRSTGDGFGLGLAIASQAFEALGGRLRLERRESGGTRAWVTLPAAGTVKN